MQAQSRFSVSGGGSSSSSSVSADELEAVIRELTRGHELTAQLREAALRTLRGKGEAEDNAAFILQQVSRAFTVCLSIMSSPTRSTPPLPEMPEPGRRPRDDSGAPRRVIVTSNPYADDGYQWRKYGQKRITNTSFPRCYFKCSYHRERGCPVTKKVQQRSNGDPPQYVVVYSHEHTCDTAAWEPNNNAAAVANPLREQLPLPGLMAARQQLGERGVQEDQEHQALVTSLACVLGAQSPAGSSTGAFGRQQQQGAPASASVSFVDPNRGELLGLDDDLDSGQLDIMDFDVTGRPYFGESYGDGLLF